MLLLIAGIFLIRQISWAGALGVVLIGGLFSAFYMEERDAILYGTNEHNEHFPPGAW